MRLTKKSKAVVAGVSMLGLVGTGTAYAYWSTSGSGTGSASTATNGVVLSYSQTASEKALGLYPGQAAQSIAGTVTNTSSTQNGFVGTVTASLLSVTKAAGAPAGTCDTTDYTLGGTPVAVNRDLGPGVSASFGGQTITFNNKSSNQDACQGATVNLTFASS